MTKPTYIIRELSFDERRYVSGGTDLNTLALNWQTHFNSARMEEEIGFVFHTIRW